MLTALLFPIASHHFDPPYPYEYNERNPGLVLEIDNDWLLGGYRNSLDRNTLLGLRRIPLAEAKGARLGLVAGVCSGYRIPFCAAGYLRLGDHVEVTYVPRFYKYNAHTLAISWRQPL